MFNLLTIGIGGFFGAICRYGIYMLDKKWYHQTAFPLGTLTVNLLGSLLIGIALALSIKYNLLSRHSFAHYLLVTGFLGAFTTFSTSSQDSFQLLQHGQHSMFISNILLNIILGIALTAGGYILTMKVGG